MEERQKVKEGKKKKKDWRAGLGGEGRTKDGERKKIREHHERRS